MPWISYKSPSPYYIRKVRKGRRWVTVYVGRGPAAEAIAELDAQASAARRDLIAYHAEQAELAEEIDASAALVTALVEALTEASLLTSGHHYDDHKEWKRLRGK